jgi:hypothetical protein
MSTDLIGGIYTREFLDADFKTTIANQSLYAGLSKQRKDAERRDRNVNLYVRQMVAHNKYKPGVETKKRIDAYVLKQNNSNEKT